MFWKSWNFWTGIFTSILFALASVGFSLPAETPKLIWDAIVQRDFYLLIGVLGNIINMLYHILFKKSTTNE